MKTTRWASLVFILVGLGLAESCFAEAADPRLAEEQAAELRQDAQALIGQGRVSEGITVLTKALKLQPQDMKSLTLLAAAQEALRQQKVPEEAWKADIQKALSRKVSFEFVDTPLTDTLAFLRQLTGVNMVVDPQLALRAGNLTVSLRVTDMSMDKALEWVCKMADARYELRNQAVFITPIEGHAAPPTLNTVETPVASAPASSRPESARASRVRVKLPDGTEFEAEGVAFEALCNMARESLDRSLDRAKDGVLAFRLAAKDIPVKRLFELLGQLAPGAKLDYYGELQLLLATSKEPSDLRRVETVMHALLRPPLPLPETLRETRPAPAAAAPVPAPPKLKDPAGKKDDF